MSASMTLGSFSIDGTAIAVLPLSNSTRLPSRIASAYEPLDGPPANMAIRAAASTNEAKPAPFLLQAGAPVVSEPPTLRRDLLPLHGEFLATIRPLGCSTARRNVERSKSLTMFAKEMMVIRGHAFSDARRMRDKHSIPRDFCRGGWTVFGAHACRMPPN
jgi:hypothetical protein